MSALAEHGCLYAADLRPRRGTEPGKVRPVLVIQTDLLNVARHASTWVLPCTTRLSGQNILRVPLPRGIAGNRQGCEVMIDQSRAIDNARFVRTLGALPRTVLREVEEKLRRLGRSLVASPIPPAPMGATIWYGPSCAPGARGIRVFPL